MRRGAHAERLRARDRHPLRARRERRIAAHHAPAERETRANEEAGKIDEIRVRRIGHEAAERAARIHLNRIQLRPSAALIRRAIDARSAREFRGENRAGRRHRERKLPDIRRRHAGGNVRPRRPGIGAAIHAVAADVAVKARESSRVRREMRDRARRQPRARRARHVREIHAAIRGAIQPGGCAVVRARDRKHKNIPAHRDLVNAASRERRLADPRPSRPAIGRAEQPFVRAARATETAAPPEARDERIARRIARVHREPTHRERKLIVGEGLPANIRRERIRRLPHAAIRRADVEDVLIRRVRRDASDAARSRMIRRDITIAPLRLPRPLSNPAHAIEARLQRQPRQRRERLRLQTLAGWRRSHFFGARRSQCRDRRRGLGRQIGRPTLRVQSGRKNHRHRREQRGTPATAEGGSRKNRIGGFHKHSLAFLETEMAGVPSRKGLHAGRPGPEIAKQR